MYGILPLCLKRFQNEIKIMKYLNILDLLYFVVVMSCFDWFLALGETTRVIYIYIL